MKKPTVAIDIDEVLADYAAEFVVMSNKLWGTTFAVEDYHEDWPALWGIGMDETLKRREVLFEDRMHERLRHNDQAAGILERLSNDFQLIVLTARNSETKGMTLAWLKQHYPMINSDHINFAGIWDNPNPDAPRQTKGAIAKSLGVDYLIDDQLKHCMAAAEYGIKALLFGEYGWNQADSLPTGVVRVKNWAEVEEYFEHAN